MYLKFFSILLLSVITVQAFHLPPDSEMEDIFGEEVANKYNRLSYQFDSNEKPNDLTANNIGQHKSKSEVKGHTHSDKIIFPSTFHHFPPYLPDPTEDDNTNENVNFEDKNTFENKINDIPMVFTNVALKPVIQNKPIIFPTDERYIISKTETKSDESDNESDISTGNLNEKLTDTNSIETYFLNRLFSIRKQNNKIDQSDESDESDESKESDESNKTNQQTSLENLLSDIFADESTSTEKQNNEESINKPNPPETTENNLDKEHQQSDDLEKLMKIIFDPFGIVELNKQIPNDDTKNLMKEIFDISDESVENKNNETSDKDIKKLMNIIFGNEVENVDESHEDNTHNEQPSNKIISTSISSLPKKVRSISEETKFDEDDHSFMNDCIQAKMNIEKFHPFFEFDKIIEIESNCLAQRKAFKEKDEIYPFKTDKSNKDEIGDSLVEIEKAIEKKEENKNTYTDDETASVTKTKDLMKESFDISDESVERKNKEISDEYTRKLMKIIPVLFHESEEVESVDESHDDNTHNEQPSNEIISTSISPLPKKAHSTSEENKFAENDHKFMEDCIQAKFNNIKHIFDPIFNFYRLIEIESNCLKQRKAIKEKDEIYPFKTDKSNEDEIEDPLYETFGFPIKKKEENKNIYTDDETASVTKTKDLMKDISDISDESVESKNNETSDKDIKKLMNIIFGDELESVDESHEDNTHNEQPSNEIISTSINPLPKKARSTSEENKFGEDDHKFMEDCIQAKFNNIKHIFNLFFDFNKIIEIESNCLEQRKAFKEKNEMYPFKTDKSNKDEIADSLVEIEKAIEKKEDNKNTYTDDETASVTKTKDLMKDISDISDESVESKNNETSDKDIKKLMNIIFGDELESVDESHEDNTHNEQPSNEIISTSINPLPKKARSTSEENKFGEDDHKFMEDCIQAKFNNIKHIFNLFFDFNKIIEIESNCLEQRKAFKEKNEMYPFKTDKSNKDEIADSLVEIEKAIEKKEDNKNTYTDDETASVTKTKDLMKEIFDISDESVESKNKEISDEDTRKVIKIIFGPFHESDEIESVDESHEDNTHNEQPSNEIISTSINPLPKKARSTSEENKFAEDDHKFMEECIQAKFNNIKHIFNPFFDFIKIIEIESNCLEQRKAFKEKNEIHPFKTDKSSEDEIEDPLYETFGFPIKKKEESKNTYTDDEIASVTTSPNVKDMNEENDEKDTEKIEENDNVNANRDIDEEIVTQSYNTESEEEDNVTLTKSDVDQLKNINNVVRKDLIDSMNNVFKMAESQIDYILHKRVKF
ncbi:kinetochore protein SLK19-like isoform X2 [Teleopsis dalmanni]|uniref:kinetochore protein SLK19-like isoform X2 n=1 Tax=Teleopsis dalmanni TaxID=139649 RepID=UPI0018CCB015|nr:kinetochore protein SLK19-like isoform X2 [Teleopsis dalmanni]